MTRSVSGSPPRQVKRRSPARSPSPVSHRHSSRRSWREHRSRSPRTNSHGRIRELEEKTRRQQEAELKLIEEETARRVEDAIRAKVQETLESDDLKCLIKLKVEEGRKRMLEDIAIQLQLEKEDALIEARRREDKIRQEKEDLEKMLEYNRQKIEESQKRAAEQQARKEEERYRELETLQRQKEEQLRRKKLEEDQNRTEQMKILGKKNTRPKLSFVLGSK